MSARIARVGHALDAAPELVLAPLDEVLDEQRDVLAALAQRRKLDREHREPVVEVLAEAPSAIARSRSRLVAATIRTSTLRVRVPPTRSNSPSCSTRSSLACTRRHLADLVEEQRAAVGQLEAPGFDATSRP